MAGQVDGYAVGVTARQLYLSRKRWMPIAFFVAGFVFDTWMLQRVDEFKTILQQAVYILASALLIYVERMEHVREIRPPGWLAPAWKFREPFLHFMLGTLLNSFTIFYFKSSSALSSLVFIALLAALLIVNEFKHFETSQNRVHFAFLSLCVTSYLVSLVPIVLGFIGITPFLLALVLASLAFYGYTRWIERGAGAGVGKPLLLQHGAITAVFGFLYFTHMIPPIPLSAAYVGIFHDVKKEAGAYQLYYSRSFWKFWQHGDQSFAARPGDAIYCFARIFSPTRFKDKIQVRWVYYDPRRGWEPSDAIPVPVEGGREEGYRLVTYKRNYQPGQWRVQIETTDDREIARIGFEVEPDADTGERSLKMTSQ